MSDDWAKFKAAPTALGKVSSTQEIHLLGKGLISSYKG